MSALEIEYGTTADGLTAARFGTDARAMIPKRDGGFFIAMGWQMPGDITVWKRDRFFSHMGDVASVEAFKLHCEAQVRHLNEKALLGRQPAPANVSTPWGQAQHGETYGPGVTAYSTASHGGFHVIPETNRSVPAALRAANGWYEEDAGWAAVAFTFGHLFTALERESARKTLRNSEPDAYEQLYATTLKPGESWLKDQRAFLTDHAADWIVHAATQSDERKGFVEVIASMGAKRGKERRFLVPGSEYEVGKFGFVVDLSRHEELVAGAPSAFVTWRN